MTSYIKNRIISIIAASAIFMLAGDAYALSLQESVSEVLKTNPVVQERLKNFHETQQDLNIAQSEYYPSLDYVVTYGRNNAGRLKPEVTDESYWQYTHSLKLTQNLFNGFSTTNKIDYQKARILAAAHHYIENANDIAFQMVQSYLDVIREYQLYQNAKDTVKINETIYEDVKSLYNTGLTTKSEMTKIFASLSLAKSNLLVQQNNTREKELRFKRLFGREIDVSTLSLPALNLALPESLERATMYAIENNPSIVVSHYNIKGSQALYKQKKSTYYPKVDFSVEQAYDDASQRNSFDGPDDRLSAYVTLSWNLFRGGADASDIQKSRSNISREVEILRDLKRQTVEGIELSWTAYEMIGNQLKELYQYNTYSQDTLDSYKSEYELGRRTLLDLLSAQNDLHNSKAEIINAQIDKLFAQYRILDAMGLLVDVVLGDVNKFNAIVEPTVKPFMIVKDSLPVALDVDKDGITDNLDICDNSLANDNIKPYGCAKKEVDSDFDGIADSKDACLSTEFGEKVDDKGCTLPNSENKFKVKQEEYTNKVTAYTQNSPEKSKKSGLYDYEFSTDPNKNVKSTELDNHLMYDKFQLIKRFEPINMKDFDVKVPNAQVDAIANEIKKYKDQKISVTLIGNTRINANKEASYEEAMQYSKTIKELLVKKGIDATVIVEQSRADFDKLYLETVLSDKKLNDRVDVALYVL